MKNFIQPVRGITLNAILITLTGIIFLSPVTGQGSDYGNSPAHRRGIITIKGRKGDKVIVEQRRHEFWFGCAISDNLGRGFRDQNDEMAYKEKFLENFNSSVEGILMWGFWAGINWIPASSMDNRDWSITKTGEAYRNLIFREWWINE